MTTESRKPGVFIKTAHHKNNKDKDNDDSNNNDNNNNYGTVIQSWISLAQWMPRTELRLSLIALWVNICLENAVKPIDTFYSFCRTSNVEIWLQFLGPT